MGKLKICSKGKMQAVCIGSYFQAVPQYLTPAVLGFGVLQAKPLQP